MSTDATVSRTQFLLSIQRALWGMVSPNLRAVAVGWEDGTVRARFVYDHPVGSDEWETVREVETSVLADLDPDVVSKFTAEFVVGSPIDFEPGESWWAFVRREI